jgi:hypothetical protein
MDYKFRMIDFLKQQKKLMDGNRRQIKVTTGLCFELVLIFAVE